MQNINPWDQEVYIQAWNFATQKHAGQTYGGSKEGMQVDYLNHIGVVAMEVMHCLQYTKIKYDANLAIQCAILHDTIEDTNTTYEEIESIFGKKVAEGILALTKNEKLSKEQKMIDSLNRINLLTAEIATVKVADRITNLYHPPFYWDSNKIESYLQESKLIAQELTKADSVLVERLMYKIKEYKKFI